VNLERIGNGAQPIRFPIRTYGETTMSETTQKPQAVPIPHPPPLPSTQPTPPALTETELVEQINDKLAMMNAAALNAVTRAFEVGELLRQAKSKVPPRQFADWLERNCKLPKRTAERYIRLAEGRKQIEEALKNNKSATVAEISLRQAERLLAAPPSPTATSSSIAAEDASTVNASEAYDNAQKRLIKRLQDLSLEAAEASANETIRELKETVATMKKGAKNAKAA
jgi:hypothetical protein